MKHQYNGRIFYSYAAHLSDERLVVQNEYVSEGQKIGITGNTGILTTNAHLHLHYKEKGQFYSFFKYLSELYMTKEEVKEIVKEYLDEQLNVLAIMDNGEIRRINQGKTKYAKVPDNKISAFMTQVLYRLRGRGFYKDSEFDEQWKEEDF